MAASRKPTGQLWAGFVDQAIVSLTTIVLLSTAAQVLELSDFGIYATCLAIIVPAVSISRTLTGESLIFQVVSARDTIHFQKVESGPALAISGAIGVAVSAVVLAGGFLTNALSGSLLTLAFLAPILVMQDCMRHVLMIGRRMRLLVIGDSILLSAAVLGSYTIGRAIPTATMLLFIWGAAAAVSLALMAVGTRSRPQLAGSLDWFRRTRKASSAFLVEALIGALTSYVIIFSLAYSWGTIEVGAYKAVMSIFGLTSVAINFLRSTFLREIRLDDIKDAQGIVRIIGVAGALVLATSALTLVLVVSLPPFFGEMIMGDVWTWIGALALWAALNRLSAGLSVGPALVLRAQGVAWRTTIARVSIIIFFLPIVALMTMKFGPSGAIFGETLLYITIALILVILSLRRIGLSRS